MQTLRNFVQRVKSIRRFERELAKATPLIDGKETRKISRAIAYDPAKFSELATGVVSFDPRETFPGRALRWARGG